MVVIRYEKDDTLNINKIGGVSENDKRYNGNKIKANEIFTFS